MVATSTPKTEIMMTVVPWAVTLVGGLTIVPSPILMVITGFQVLDRPTDSVQEVSYTTAIVDMLLLKKQG